MQSTIIRKDLKSLKPWQSERFWACFIYLNILPPTYHHAETGKILRKSEVYYQVKDKEQITYRSYEPLNRYDEFISSHAAVCEHRTNYFGHYHRHLMILVQLALNEADRSLKNREIPNKFNNADYQPFFEAVFDRYAQIMQGCQTQETSSSWVALNYWNPLDYRNKFQFPSMLQPGEKIKRQKDAFWILHKKYLQCDFGERNFKHTWNQNQNFTDKSFWNDPEASSFKPHEYSTTQQSVLDGNYSRDNEDQTKAITGMKSKIWDNKSIESYQTIYNSSKVHLQILNQQQLNLQYGGQKYCWFPDAELKKNQDLTAYNKSIPHFTYAQSLEVPFSEFCTIMDDPENQIGTVQNFLIRFQDPHNQMHNYLGFSMIDGSYSILNPLFMVYHSYIDYMLEVQVRRANEDPTKEAYNSMINFTELAFNYNENNKRFAHNNDLETLLQVFHWQNNLQSFDEYPLMEWIDTESIISFNEARKEGIKFTTNYQENVNFQSCKTYGEYVFYNEKIRQATQVQQFYNSSKYVGKVPGYPFNYNYDLLPSNVSGDDLIPSYIRVIFDEDTTQNSLFASKVALREKSANGPVLEKGDSEMLKAIFKKKGDGVSSLKIEKIKSLSLSFNNKVKGFNKLYAFLNYPSNTPNQIVQLSFKIKDIKNFNFGNCKALSSDFEKKAKNSNGVIPVDFHSIFNRGERAKGCPRCTSHKTVVKNIFNYLVGYFYPFYIDLIVNSNFGTLYNSKNPENVEKNFSDLIEFKHSSTNKHFRFECLEGASEVKFRSKFVKNIDDEKSEEIIGSAKIDLVGFIYEAKTNKEFIYTEQKGCGQNCEFNFVHINDSTKVEEKAIYLYRDFKCSIKNQKGEEKKFNFSLKNFERHAVYDILIDADNNVAIRDANILEKRQYLW